MAIFAKLADNGLSGCRAVVVNEHCDGEYNMEMLRPLNANANANGPTGRMMVPALSVCRAGYLANIEMSPRELMH